ncbi:MAG: aminotransferase class IV [Merismopedia sp. SIO2A8]|nr:aminotransferase class IV [Symploca sp. SIO2B6]NET50875.1 aminotransferase class IV [Merismopedia sp. SIO2A8]
MYWYDGRLIHSDTIELPVAEPGLLYGATVFTTLRVWQQSLEHPLSFWDAHCTRLHQSICCLGWAEPDWEHVDQGANHLALHYPVLRVTVFPDGREWITGRSLPSNLHQWQQEGIKAWVAPKEWRRSLPHYKTGNYLACWLALQTAQQMGYQEAILVDSHNNWLETSTGSLWGWYDNCWWTPSLTDPLDDNSERILPGVARSHLISALKWHNRQVQESVWSMDLVSRFEALFYTNSVRYVVAIAHVHQPIHPQKYEKGLALNYPVNHAGLQGILDLFCSIP